MSLTVFVSCLLQTPGGSEEQYAAGAPGSGQSLRGPDTNAVIFITGVCRSFCERIGETNTQSSIRTLPPFQETWHLPLFFPVQEKTLGMLLSVLFSQESKIHLQREARQREASVNVTNIYVDTATFEVSTPSWNEAGTEPLFSVSHPPWIAPS